MLPITTPTWNNLTACTEVVAFRAIDFAHANALLPLGYEAGDAGLFIRPGGASANVGKALVILGVFQCEGYGLGPGPLNWAGLVVYLKTPRLAGVELDPSFDDLYLLSFHTDQALVDEALRSIGAPASRSHVESTFDIAASGPTQAGTGSASVRDPQGELLSFQIGGGPRAERDIVVRFWSQDEAGISLLEFRRDPTGYLASGMLDCSLRPGSVFERAFGSTTCGQDAVGALWPDPTGFESSYRRLDGAVVG